ncbi:Bestrophin-3 [Halotydeus destructor]|nr:Bestrophin-3 [Halotydeus destructor]
MTVTYSLNVANAKLTGFSKLLLRWKGSIYKLLYREMALFCSLYYLLSFLYRYVLNDNHRVVFEKIALYCEAFTNLVPLTFVLGFYVSIVVTRWWQQFMQIPWPDKAVALIVANVHGSDERGRIIRRTLARYLLLLQVLTCQAVSTSVRRRFPTLDHIVAAGIMTKEEKIVFDEIPGSHGKWWSPGIWFGNLLIRSRKEGRIKDDILLQQLLDELHVYRSCCGMMFAYDWISIPLVYTQTVTIATYTYFLATVMGRQYLDPSKGYSNHDVDLYIPVFTIFEFFFFMGWLKVAEQLINPYGEDDDDFELNWCLDRNLVVSFWIVDDMYNKHPKLVKDMYWDDIEPSLPYTRSAALLRTNLSKGAHLGSAMNLDIDPNETEFAPLETIMEEETDQMYKSEPTSPNADLISIVTTSTIKDLDQRRDSDNQSIHSGLKMLADSVKGSRIFNMIIGQSTENVAQTPAKDTRSLLPPSAMPTFALKTPRKRLRTTSINDPTRIRTTSSSLHVNSVDVMEPTSNMVGYGDLPTAPVIGSARTPNLGRHRTPGADRRSLASNERDSSLDLTGNMRQPGTDGFRFPQAFVAPGNQSQYFPNMLPRNRSVTSVSMADDEATETDTPVLSLQSAKSSSGLESVSSSVSIDVEPKTPSLFSKDSSLELSSKSKAEEESPYEPNSSSSDESLSPFNSNQNTVTSITELLAKKKE